LVGHLGDQTPLLDHAVKVVLNGNRQGRRCQKNQST